MNNLFLENLFIDLDKNRVDYLVLRGYQKLPHEYSYDIDFSVINERELSSFFKVLHNLSGLYQFTVSRDVVRVGLLKVFLHFGKEILKIDVFCAFQYAGLEYMDAEMLHKTKRRLPSGIYVPLLNYELAISLLKEILHNSRIREDKVVLLRTQYDSVSFYKPFIKYFTNVNITDLSIALFSKGNLKFKGLALKMKFSIFWTSTLNHGLLHTCSSIFYFFQVKYVYQMKYDYVILKNDRFLGK